jgi:GNAT superfamily N-acetyltransferase
VVDGLSGASSGVRLRPATAEDRPFLFAVFRTTRDDELALTDWTEPEKDAFLDAQFRAQDAHYREAYPDGRFLVVCHDREPIGRLSLARLADEVRVVDIALLPAWRGRGIGSTLLAGVLAEADAAGVAVRLHVEPWNPVKRLYARLGFRTVQMRGIHEFMERPAVGSAGQLKTAS